MQSTNCCNTANRNADPIVQANDDRSACHPDVAKPSSSSPSFSSATGCASATTKQPIHQTLEFPRSISATSSLMVLPFISHPELPCVASNAETESGTCSSTELPPTAQPELEQDNLDRRRALTRLIVKQALADATNNTIDSFGYRHSFQQQQQQRRLSLTESQRLAKSQDGARHVRFSATVQVREHNVVVGSHPWTRLPLELGWNYQETTRPMPLLEEDIIRTHDDEPQPTIDAQSQAALAAAGVTRRSAVPRWTFEERKDLFQRILSSRMDQAKLTVTPSAPNTPFGNIKSRSSRRSRFYLQQHSSHWEQSEFPRSIASRSSHLYALGNPGVAIDV